MEDLTPGPERPPFTFEKWYVDALLPDGTVLLVYIGRLVVCGLRAARLTADLYFPDGTHLRGGTSLPYIRGGHGWLDARSVSIRGDVLAFRRSRARPNCIRPSGSSSQNTTA
jgi:hypothetical protein